jgi:hypothetical protein
MIADFMGENTWESEQGNIMAMSNGSSGLISEILPYDKDFNLIIKVSEKIESLNYHVSFSSRQAQISDKHWKLIIDADFCDTFMENAYEGIVAFIEWYNKKV